MNWLAKSKWVEDKELQILQKFVSKGKSDTEIMNFSNIFWLVQSWQIDYFVRFNFPLEITVSGMFCGKFHTLSQLCGHSQLYLSADLGDKKNLMFFVIKGLVYKDTKTHYLHYTTNISAFKGLSNLFLHSTWECLC